ncbi:ParB/RepB/Spo0J family partition protein [Xenorhabdus bovienii]|uniref:RepB plasmid partitioning protein n=4 Tax=Xenorhabdus bovienii TaxID=40576 RepID=A0A077PI21_XENBV|nr:plasmid partitioning protein RepB C-terminal domain-containing protein [Xenorhabdus bovienii]MDE9455128.1 ParB N-terminal domain-containing protein [Xenorhabdus bovienii]CDG89520.1 RepB plasmid partitioning protein [Xenorhabdus bovienii str. feltiae France]CDG92349.1 RepB plasmid partitioning protein [Xenorhabdus bovienii str. feltiae Florida]CDH20673.1 RepB plasmid partitioning protein [Xenorhabdus bovienii str. kraussei Quebec]
MLKVCFNNELIDISIEKMMASKPLPENVKSSIKYNQIKLSIKEIGLIEPIIIYFDDTGKSIKILDGHLRIEAMKELGIKKACCIVSTINDCYTPNKHVNHLTIIEEQKMLKKALISGVSIEKLSAALGISQETLKNRFRVTQGIASEAASLLSDKHIPVASLNVLRKMQPLRQIESANIMTSVDNFSAKFALSLLHATPDSLLKNSNIKKEKSDIQKNLTRLEKEMAMVQTETKKHEEHYGANTLKLVIIKSHIANLLNNTKILHWLFENKPDYLSLLKKISDLDSLTEQEK